MGATMKQIAFLLVFYLALPATADIYKCRLPNGATEISNAPCTGGSNTITVRPDEAVSEANRQRAEHEVERMRNYVEQREAAQRADTAAERERQASQRQAIGNGNIGSGRSVDECLRDLDQRALEANQRAQLEAACRNNPASTPTYIPVPVPMYGGGGNNPLGQCIANVMRLKLAPAEQNSRIAQCQGSYAVPSPLLVPPQAMPPARPVPRPETAPPSKATGAPTMSCPPGNKNCIR